MVSKLSAKATSILLSEMHAWKTWNFAVDSIPWGTAGGDGRGAPRWYDAGRI